MKLRHILNPKFTTHIIDPKLALYSLCILPLSGAVLILEVWDAISHLDTPLKITLCVAIVAAAFLFQTVALWWFVFMLDRWNKKHSEEEEEEEE